jgi:folylpolyglutamate synthase
LDPKDPSSKPAYFRFLTLMAFHTYMSEAVDVAIVECGIGGEYDSTNVLTAPVITGITSLGIDHEAVLGDTIEEIAWHKAGIMKQGAKCFISTGQKASAMRVLRERAAEKDIDLQVVEVDPDIESGKTKLGLQADFQKINASLGVAIVKEWLNMSGIEVSANSVSAKIKKGLSDVQWGGRCETRHETGISWYIDGGHTLESIKLAGQWFAEELQSQPNTTNNKPVRVLIFNQQTRDASALAEALHGALSVAMGDQKPFTHAIFCTNTTFKETGFRPDLVSVNVSASDVQGLRVQKALATTWAERDPSTDVQVVRTIEEAVAAVRAMASLRSGGENVTALVTGSLHVVGGLLEVLETTTRITV